MENNINDNSLVGNIGDALTPLEPLNTGAINVNMQPQEVVQPQEMMQPNNMMQPQEVQQPQEMMQPNNMMQPQEVQPNNNNMMQPQEVQPQEMMQPNNMMQPQEVQQTQDVQQMQPNNMMQPQEVVQTQDVQQMQPNNMMQPQEVQQPQEVMQQVQQPQEMQQVQQEQQVQQPQEVMQQVQQVQQVQQEQQVQNAMEMPLDINTNINLDGIEGGNQEDFATISSAINEDAPKELIEVQPEGLTKITTLSTGNWSVFHQIATFIVSHLDNDSNLNIQNGKIKTYVSGTLIETDLTKIVSNDLDLCISNPDTFIKKTKSLIGGDHIQIFADYTNSDYIFSKVENGKITTSINIGMNSSGSMLDNSLIPEGLAPISAREFDEKSMVIINTFLGIQSSLGYEFMNFCYSTDPSSLNKLAGIKLNNSVSGKIDQIYIDNVEIDEYATSFLFTKQTSSAVLELYKTGDKTFLKCINNIKGSTGSITLTEAVRKTEAEDEMTF